MVRVKIYSTPTCPYCTMAKDYFDSKGIKYEEVDISEDAEAAEEMEKLSGEMGVPQVVIGDKIVVGFDVPAFEKMLKDAKAKEGKK